MFVRAKISYKGTKIVCNNQINNNFGRNFLVYG